MVRVKPALELAASCLVYSLTVTLIDFVTIFFFFSQEPNQLISSLSFIMLIEGGLGLIVGGAVALYSPTVNKVGEVFFHFKPWSAKRQKAAEKGANVWIATGALLVFEALLISAL
ncbi:MAG: hypothetical protein ACUVRA_06510 [Candidatus Bathyarchaeaceae archaeon]